jgi:hypothetical protein
MYNYQIGTAYNFNTLAPAILGATFNNAKLLSIMDFNTAMKFTNIAQQAQIVYPVLPAGTPTDPSSYVYLLFQTSTGATVVLANVWINESTIVVSTTATITVVVTNVTTADVSVIRNMLLNAGYTSLNIKTS